MVQAAATSTHRAWYGTSVRMDRCLKSRWAAWFAQAVRWCLIRRGWTNTLPRSGLLPQSVTRRQARQALLLAGLLDNVQPALDAIPDATQRRLMQIEWDDSQEFHRNRPALLALAGALGLNSSQIDQLFITAAGL